MTRKEFNYKAVHIKGEIINYINIIEYLTNYYLSGEVIKKNHLFGMALINKIGFNDKIAILKQVLAEGESKFLETFPDLMKNLTTMQQLRNKFAHSIYQIESVDDYSKLEHFTLLKTDKFDAKDFARTSYLLSEHADNVNLLWKTITELTKICKLPADFNNIDY